MSVIFNLECSEHKEGSVGPLIVPLAFNYLCAPFRAPILSPPSTPTHLPYYYHVQYHLKSCSNSLNLGWLKVIHPHNYNTTGCCNFNFFTKIHQEAIIQLLLKIAISLIVVLRVEAVLFLNPVTYVQSASLSLIVGFYYCSLK